MYPARTPPSTICYQEKRLLPTTTSMIAICAKPTHRCRMSLLILTVAMHITERHQDTGAGLDIVKKDANFTVVNVSHSTSIVSKTKDSHQTTPARQRMDIFHVRLGSFCAIVWFAIASGLAVNMQISFLFINNFIHDILLSKRKIVPQHSHPVKVLSTNQSQESTSPQKAAPISKRTLGDNVGALTISIRVAWQIVLELYTQHSVLVTNYASSIQIVRSRALRKSMQPLSAAYGAIVTLPSQAFHILHSNFSTKTMRLLKRVVVAYARGPPTAVMISRSSPHQLIPMSTPERVDESTRSDVTSAEGDKCTSIGKQ